jgi:hypothetical protein
MNELLHFVGKSKLIGQERLLIKAIILVRQVAKQFRYSYRLLYNRDQFILYIEK